MNFGAESRQQNLNRKKTIQADKLILRKLEKNKSIMKRLGGR